MKIFRQLIQFSLMAIAFAISSTLASCSSDTKSDTKSDIKSDIESDIESDILSDIESDILSDILSCFNSKDKEDDAVEKNKEHDAVEKNKEYDAVENEVFRELELYESLFEGRNKQKDYDLILQSIEKAKGQKDYDFAKKYYFLLRKYAEKYDRTWGYKKYDPCAESLIEYYLDENQLSYAKELVSSEMKGWPDKKSKYEGRIEKEEVTYLISLKSEDAANRIVSLLKKPGTGIAIGEECKVSYNKNGQPIYNRIEGFNSINSKFNSKLDEYLDIALSQNSDVAAKKILCQYLKVAELEYYEKNGNKYVKVIGFSDQPRKDAIKRYKDAKELW